MTAPSSRANRGIGWELVCSDILDRAEAAGLLVWHRFPVPVEQVGPVKRGGRFEAIRSDRASPAWGDAVGGILSCYCCSCRCLTN